MHFYTLWSLKPWLVNLKEVASGEGGHIIGWPLYKNLFSYDEAGNRPIIHTSGAILAKAIFTTHSNC